MGFHFGEMDVREQSPWAYDATNDIPKSHPWYPVAAGLANYLQHSINPLGIAGFYDSAGTISYTVPTAKAAYLCDFFVSAQASGPVQFDVMINGASAGIPLQTPAGGGVARYEPRLPLKAVAGDVITFQLYNAGATAAGGVAARVAYAVL